MDGMSVVQTRSMIIWIAWAVGAQLLRGLVPPLMRLGARRVHPAACAALFAAAFCVGACGVAALKGVLGALWSIDNATLVGILLCGALSAFTWLCLFTALTGGMACKVMPVMNLHIVLILVATHFLLGTPLGLWRLCCMVLLLLGTVLMESRGAKKGARNRLWTLYAGLAALSYTGLQLMMQVRLARVEPALVDVGRGVAATILLLIFLFARGKQKAFDKAPATAWVCVPLGALLCGGSAAMTYLASLHGDMSLLAPTTVLGFAAMLAFSKILLKERLPGSAVFGALLVLLGMFAIQMGW